MILTVPLKLFDTKTNHGFHNRLFFRTWLASPHGSVQSENILYGVEDVLVIRIKSVNLIISFCKHHECKEDCIVCPRHSDKPHLKLLGQTQDFCCTRTFLGAAGVTPLLVSKSGFSSPVTIQLPFVSEHVVHFTGVVRRVVKMHISRCG